MTAVLPIIAAIARRSAGRVFITAFFILKSTCSMLLSIAAAS